MANFQPFNGTVTVINDFPTNPNNIDGGSYQLFSVQNRRGDVANFVVASDTYFVNH